MTDRTKEINFSAVVAALAGRDPPPSPPPGFANLLKPFTSFGVLMFIHRTNGIKENFNTWIAKLFFHKLPEVIGNDVFTICSDNCPCCLGLRDRVIQKIARTRVAKLIEDPSSAESSKLLEKYGEATLDAICVPFMY